MYRLFDLLLKLWETAFKKNNCSFKIIIAIDNTKNCLTQFDRVTRDVSTWMVGRKYGRMRKAGIDSRGSSESCTWEFAVGTRHRDRCMIKYECQLLRSIITKSFKEVCCSWLLPCCPQVQSRIAIGTSTSFVKSYSVSYQTLNTKERV